MITTEEAKHKLNFLKKAYQKLIDEKVDSGKLVGDGVRGEWKAETPLDEVYKDMIELLDLAIKALEQQPKWIPCEERLPEESGFYLVLKKQRTGECQVALAHYAPEFGWSGNGNFKQVIKWISIPEDTEVEK